MLEFYLLSRLSPPAGYHVTRKSGGSETECGLSVEAAEQRTPIGCPSAQMAHWPYWCETCFAALEAAEKPGDAANPHKH